MTKKGFNLLRRIDHTSKKDLKLKNYYYEWKINDKNQGFAMIYDSFHKNEILSKIDGGALKLYLYLSLVSKNETGESWYSIESLAEYFKVQTRTVDKWFKNLIDLDLIYRYRSKGRSHTTYLLPYETTTINHKINQRNKDLKTILIEINHELKKFDSIYGEIVSYFHLVQWRVIKSVKGEDDQVEPFNFLLVITKRKGGTIIGHLYALREALFNYGISELYGYDFYLFDSPLKTERFKVTGLSLPDSPKLTTDRNKKDLIKLVNQLNEISEDELSTYDKVMFDHIDKFDYSNDKDSSSEEDNSNEEDK